ncbi:hypothetical protein TNCV_2260841 [Trichonephila clavipes]|nr:hypothetical protein TNCV_2260841 [Trichonephila clavipes]
MHNATVQQLLTTVSPNSNLIMEMLQAEVGLVSKHYVIPFRCRIPPFIAPLEKQTPVVSVQGKMKKLPGAIVAGKSNLDSNKAEQI